MLPSLMLHRAMKVAISATRTAMTLLRVSGDSLAFSTASEILSSISLIGAFSFLAEMDWELQAPRVVSSAAGVNTGALYLRSRKGEFSMKRVFAPVVFLSCALALGSGFVLAQQKTPPRPQEEPVFGASVDVRVVNVEVVVTDKAGNRVSGLKPSDFRLNVDGKQVPVDYFSEILGGQSVAAPPVAGEPAPAVPAVEPGRPVGTSYLVFIDDYFPIEIRRNEVLKSLKNDLGRLGPEDRMAIIAYDGGRLSLVSTWSQSQAELAGAFDKAMARPTHGLDRVTEFSRFSNNLAFAASSTTDSTARVSGNGNTPLDLNSRMDSSGLSPLESDYAKMLFRQEEGAVRAAARTLRTFASPPGRKVMLLLDGGWPYSIESYIRGVNTLSISREVKDGEQLFRP